MRRRLALTILYATASQTVLGMVLAVVGTNLSRTIFLAALAAIAAISWIVAGLHDTT